MKPGRATGARGGTSPRAFPRISAAEVSALRRAVTARLLPWFRRQARALPWRRRRTPYRVLVSEIMLQQTRVETVIPYYHRWLRRFPTLGKLAAAEVDDALKLWEGLGYYARARHLHRLARRLTAAGGRWPRTLDGLRALPGLGDYTAAAVGSLAFGLDAACVDGNVARVLSRATARQLARSRPAAQAVADALLPPGRAGAFNEALMELGATVCTPRRPRCDVCPLRAVCRAYALGRVGEFPARRPARRLPHLVVGAAVTLNRRGEVLIARRKDDSMLGGLWEFPGGKREPGETLPQCIAREMREELGVDVVVGAPLTVVHHAYSHFTIELHAHFARLRRGRPRALHCAACAWSPVSRLRERAFSKADHGIIAALEAWNAESRG